MMHVLEIELTEFTRRRRSVVVDHAATGLPDPLRPDEHVLVRDVDGEIYSAQVSSVEDVETGLRYRLTIGGRGILSALGELRIPRPRTASE